MVKYSSHHYLHHSLNNFYAVVQQTVQEYSGAE